MLRGLDKTTARTETFTVPIGEATRFGTLWVTARACQQKPPEEAPDSSAFLEIAEPKVGGGFNPLFSGWMFASTPGLSALAHPVYDVWVLSCDGVKTPTP